MYRTYTWNDWVGKSIHSLLPPPADSTTQGNKKYGHSSSCTYEIYKSKIIVGPDGFTAPCRSVAKQETGICFLIQTIQ